MLLIAGANRMKIDRCLAGLALLLAALNFADNVSAEAQRPPSATLSFRPSTNQPAVPWIAGRVPEMTSPTSPDGPFVEADSPSPQGLTLAELESIAMANNPTLRQAAMRVRAARAKRLQEGLYPNPVIGYRGEEMGDEGTAGLQGGFIGQEIVTAGKLRLRTAVAGHEVREAQQAFHAQRARVLNDVHIGMYEVLVAQRTVELNRRLVDIGREGVTAANRLLEAMEVSRVDVLQAKIEADSSALRLHDAENRHRAACRGWLLL